MRIKHKVNVRIGDDSDMTDLLFAPDDTNAEVVIDGYERMVSGKLSIPLNTNEDVPLGDITAVKGIYIIVDQDVVVTLNGGAETIQLRKSGTESTVTAKLFLEADITQVNIAAPVLLDVVGTWCAWGDATA